MDAPRHLLPEAEIALDIVRDLVMAGAERPGIDEAMVRQLHDGEGVGPPSQSGQGYAAAVGRRGEAGSHEREGRRCGNRPRSAEIGVDHLIAVEGDAIGGQQQCAEAGLPLPEQLEVKGPDALDVLDGQPGAILVPQQGGERVAGRSLHGSRSGAIDHVGEGQQSLLQAFQQPIRRADVGRGRAGQVRAELADPERAQCLRVPPGVQRLGPSEGGHAHAGLRRGVAVLDRGARSVSLPGFRDPGFECGFLRGGQAGSGHAVIPRPSPCSDRLRSATLVAAAGGRIDRPQLIAEDGASGPAVHAGGP